jgi:2-dehydropantoate 2-reductase
VLCLGEARARENRPDSSSEIAFMKFCIYGAGAIGGYIAVELADAGHDVCVIARGEHLKAIQQRGLLLRIGGREKIVQRRTHGKGRVQ